MLPEIRFRTEDLPSEHRFDSWRERMAKTICPMEMRSEHAEDFRAETRLLRLGAVEVWPGTLQPMSWFRTERLVRQSDPEQYHLSYVLTGSMGISQAGREEVHGPQQMYIVDTSTPFDCATGALTGIGLEVPRRLIPIPREKTGRLLARGLSGTEGFGALLAQVLAQLGRGTEAYQPDDAVRLGTVVVDLLSALLAHELEAEKALSPESHRRTLLLRVKAFILQHLADPGLTPGAIAEAHHISLGYLHRLFREEEVTVTAFVRRERLAGARRDLAEPALAGTPIHAVAARWGFPRAADFTRAFTAAYGMPPREHRLKARGEHGSGPGGPRAASGRHGPAPGAGGRGSAG